MYGSSGQLGGRGRGSGRGGRGKRNRSLFPPPPPSRPILPISTTTSNRLSTGGGASSSARNRHESANVSSSPDESYSLVSDDPLSYAMIIRLAPDLVEEIRRVEAQGETARIKFDSNANNSCGNVIDVGGKDFRFTWSQEVGDLCDIYEERRSSDDGKGLLIESGCPWRKLAVQRILDESAKNHMKMRSEEAEQKSKARKTLVLDHGNPSVKNQLRSLAAAAVDSNPWKMGMKSKKEPAPKKRKVEPPSQGPPKYVFKAGLSSSATPPKGRLPFPSPKQPFASTSPFGSASLSKAPAAMEVPRASKENTVTEKVTPSRTVHAVGRETSRIRKGSEATPKDLQSMLITILLENPNGMTIKSLEKELGDSVPNCCKKIEPILKKIAIYKAPGRYSLKTGVDLDLESFKKLSSGSGSSPEFAHDQTPVKESNAVEKATSKELEHQKQLDSKQEESNLVDIVETQQNSPNTFGDKKTSDHSDGHASSSDSDSDSSDSISSGSQSKSRSKSRSPVGSGSTSDSESECSSSSKEGSDVDVDIMTGDDDREESGSKLQAHITTAPMPWRTPDDGTVQNGISRDKQDAQLSDAVDIDGDFSNDDIEIDILGDDDTVPFETNMRSLEENVMPGLSQPGNGQQRSFVRNADNESQNMTTYSDLDSSNRNVRAKSRKGSELNYFHEKSDRAKRMKSGGLNPPQTSGRRKDSFALEDPQHLSLDRPDDDNYNVQLANKVGRDGVSDTSSRKGYNLAMPGISVSDAQHLGQRSVDLNARGKAFDITNRYTENLARGVEHSERSPSYPRDKFSMNRDKHSEDAYGNEKSVGKSVGECVVADKQSIPSDSQFRRYDEEVTKVKDAKQMPDSYMGSLPTDTTKTDPEKSPVVNGKGKVLRREVSELELGELRELLPAEETQGVKTQFGRNNSFRNPKNKSVVPDNLDLNGRTAAKTIQESRKLSPPNSRVVIGSTQVSSFRKRTPEDDNEDSWMRPQQRFGQYQAPQMPRADLTDSETGSQLNKLSDMGSQSRKNGYGDTNKKGSVSIPQQPETNSSGQAAVPNNVKESKALKSSTMPESNKRKNRFGLGSHNSNLKRRESSSDEVNCPYSKYEKDEPELRGPIKDISQYKDYVREYCEKYESYCTLNENLETYRNDFDKLGRDLALAKSKHRRRYYDILEQLKESYRQCGTRHKRLKKLFILLHEELKHLKQRINDYALPYTRERAEWECCKVNLDPVSWWLFYGAQFPSLQRIAVKILSQTNTSSGSERIWSVFERIHTKLRNRLVSSRINDLVYVQYNLKLEEQRIQGKARRHKIDVHDVHSLLREDNMLDWIAGEDETPVLPHEEYWLNMLEDEAANNPETLPLPYNWHDPEVEMPYQKLLVSNFVYDFGNLSFGDGSQGYENANPTNNSHYTNDHSDHGIRGTYEEYNNNNEADDNDDDNEEDYGYDTNADEDDQFPDDDHDEERNLRKNKRYLNMLKKGSAKSWFG